MDFGWLSVTGALLVILLQVPSDVYDYQNRSEKRGSSSRMLNALERICRYAAMLTMILPLWKGYASVASMLIWSALCVVLLVACGIGWRMCFARRCTGLKAALEIVPGLVFSMRGMFLRGWPLLVCGVLFAVFRVLKMRSTT